MAVDAPATRRFYLVQRLKRNRLADRPAPKEGGALAALGSNPFGYGELGDYDLDYMGSAEFEFGAIPKAYNRLAEAKKGIVLEQKNYGGHDLDFLYIEKEGDPFDDWCAWVEGQPYVTRWGSECPRIACEGKERPYDLKDRLDGKDEPEWGWQADIWWALDENVMWAFSADRHLPRMIESMKDGPKRLRG